EGDDGADGRDAEGAVADRPLRTRRRIQGLQAATCLKAVSLEEVRLGAAARAPLLEVPGSALLVDRRRDGRETKSRPALRSRPRDEFLVAADSLVEVVENRRAVDQVLAVVEH